MENLCRHMCCPTCFSTAEASCHVQASQDWRTLMQQVAAAPSWVALAEQPEGLVKRLRELHVNLQEAQGGTAAFCKVRRDHVPVTCTGASCVTTSAQSDMRL